MKTPTRPIHLACALTLSLIGLSATIQAETLPVAGGAISTSLTGKVTVVNVEKRLLTLQTPEGRFEVLRVPPQVKRLNEIKIGNTLTITETQFILVDLQKGADVGEPGVSSESVIVRDPGDKPAGIMIDSLTVTGTITALNKAKSTVTIQGPEEHITLKVEDPSVLDSVAVGDGVSASYARSISGAVKF